MKFLDRLHMKVFFAVFSTTLLIMCGEGLNILTDGTETGTPTDPGFSWTDFSYKRSVTIQENSGTSLSDFQVNITLNSSNFSFTNAEANGEDIRFNYNDESLPYWIESWDQSGETASVWVKVPSIPASSDRIIYIYYGDSTKTSESNFSNTFTKAFNQLGLVGEWHMDEGAGTTVSDSSGYNNDGTITNAVWNSFDGGGWYDNSLGVSFSTGDSLYFDGSGDYVSIPDDNSLDVGYITIEAWIETGNDLSGGQYIISKFNETSDQRSYALMINSGNIRFSTNKTDGYSSNTDSLDGSSLTTNTVYHIAVTSDGANKKIYINGEPDTSAAWVFSIYTNSTSDLIFGARESGGVQPFKGTVDEVKIYNDALSAEAILAHSKRSQYVSPVPGISVGSEEPVQ